MHNHPLLKVNKNITQNCSMGFDILGISVFGKDYKKMTPMQVGLDYITKFFQSSYFTGNKNPNVYIGLLVSKSNATSVNRQIESLGNSIQAADLSESQVKNSADSLAKLAGNRYPKAMSDFRFALIDQVSSTPLVDYVVNSSTVKNLQKVGDSIINVAEAGLSVAQAGVEGVGFMAKIVAAFPYIVPIGGAYLLYKLVSSDLFKEVSKTAVKTAVKSYTGGK